MQKVLLFMAIMLISSCSAFVAGKLSDERKSLYDYNNTQEYCHNNPDKCYKNLPKY